MAHITHDNLQILNSKPLTVAKVKTLQQTEPSRFGGLGLLGTTHRLLKA